jgi:uncharacterized protein YdaU (DUF1376 family)
MSDLRALPYYKWFWQDWRANRKAQRMSYIERGLYRELLDECWVEGSIPNDIASLAEICGCPKDVMANAWQVLESCFELLEGKYINKKMESMRTEKDAERLAKSQSGKKGGVSKSMNSKPKKSIAKQVVASAKQVLAPPNIEEKRREEGEEQIKTPKKASKLTINELPDDWKEFCSKERPELEPKKVFESFKDYWTSVAGVKADWTATWRNWVRKETVSPTNKKSVTTGSNLMKGVTYART